MSEPSASNSKALPIIALLIRVVTLILLLASLIVLATDTATFTNLALQEVTLHFKDIYAYRYMLSTTVIGLTYTFLQIPFAIHLVSSGKRMINHVGLLYFDFYGDKWTFIGFLLGWQRLLRTFFSNITMGMITLCLLATGVGAAFGATKDLQKNLDDLDRLVEQLGYTMFSTIRSKIDNFFNMAFVSASLLLMAFLCFIVSSIISSLSLSKKG